MVPLKVLHQLAALLTLLQLLLESSHALLSYQRLSLSSKTMGKNLHIRNVHAPSSSSWTMQLNPTSFANTDYIITEFPRPALRRIPNQPIGKNEFDTNSSDFSQLTSEMISIMYEAKGVGLAAPQIGKNIQLFVYNPTGSPTDTNMERIVCNPVIQTYSKETIVEQEGCLSLRSDDCAGQVSRSEWIEVVYQNELGQQIRRRLKGFEARVFQHEYDDLQGILCWDRFCPEDRVAVQANIDKLLGLYPDPDAITEPDANILASLQPPPLLTASRMPPLDMSVDDASSSKKAMLKTASKSGFGVGGGGGSRGNSKKKKKKRK